MFLDSIRLIYASPCSAAANRVRAVGRLSSDISAVLPYLNAVLEDAVYDRAYSSLTFKTNGRQIILRPTEVNISYAESTTEALKIAEWLKLLINDTWARRSQITPDFSRKRSS